MNSVEEYSVRALLDPALLRDRVEDRVALLLRAAVGHREHRVGPVLVGGALVAVGDAAEGGHQRRQLHDPLLRHLPDPHPVGGEAGAAMEEDRGHAAQRLALLHRLEMLEQLVLGDADLRGRRRVGLGDDRHVPLQRADHRDTSRSDSSIGSGSIGSCAAPGGGQVLGGPSISRLMLILNSLSVGSWRIDSAPVSSASTSSVPCRPSRDAGLGGDREPHVEVVVAQVVVRDAGVGVHDPRSAVRVLRVDLGGHEHRAVAEHARVEDRRDLAHDALVEQPLRRGASTSSSLTSAMRRDVGIGRGDEREAALHQVQQPLVQLVQRHGGAVLARAHLGHGRRLPHRSHPAASFAW